MLKRPMPEKRVHRAGRLPSGGGSADRSKTFVSMPKPDKRGGKPHLRVLLADGVLGDLDIKTARVALDFIRDDDDGWTARVISSGDVKVRRPASGRNYIDVGVPASLAIAIPKREELRLIERVEGLPVFAIPPGVSIEELEG